jgi:hypothetical protein
VDLIRKAAFLEDNGRTVTIRCFESVEIDHIAQVRGVEPDTIYRLGAAVIDTLHQLTEKR